MKTHIAGKNTRLVLIGFLLGSSMVMLACNAITALLPTTTPTPADTPTFTASPTVTASATLTKTPSRTPRNTATPSVTPTRSVPSGTPMARWNHIPIMPNALSAEGLPEERFYTYVTHSGQERVLDFYMEELPRLGWEVDGFSSNDEGGYIIYRKDVLDFIYISEQGDLTFVTIFLSTGSPSLDS